ncbi:GNAT family N-acetyltransferase [Algihabitans albus]|uniref:GNAT family N-acetyltransferase n=1 Tax=Algihabitans albus TaxID=2164067 RepID=UPI000E5D03F2|nr:GNAT family N-acetyltransferase [Algihabitans albus]
MPDGADSLTLRTVASLGEVTADQWDACAGTANPFVSHAFLSAVEDSGSATAERGWLGQHLLLEKPDGTLLGAVPLYLKSHSYGEYVFDWGWADAYERAGGSYYPKLQSSVPFTPVTGPRLLSRPGMERDRLCRTLIAGLAEVTKRHEASSLHVTFPEREEWTRLGEAGLLTRIGLQYHWHNPGYASFDAFLDTLVSRKRKAIKKERRKVQESGLRLRALVGDEIQERHWDAFHRFYLDTIDKKWSRPYLTRDFFLLLGERLGPRVVLIVAEQGDEVLAGALNLMGDDALYGRNWGCAADHRFLHFEACYYQAIDFAIAQGLKRVEAGAQGEHKIQRGYLPVETYSAHLIPDPGFREAVAHFLKREAQAVRAEIAALGDWSPYRATAPE